MIYLISVKRGVISVFNTQHFDLTQGYFTDAVEAQRAAAELEAADFERWRQAASTAQAFLEEIFLYPELLDDWERELYTDLKNPFSHPKGLSKEAFSASRDFMERTVVEVPAH